MLKKPNNPKREPVKVVAIIPARGGKQSIPWKNLQKLGGKTLLAWAVGVAMEASKVDAVIVSTEDPKIAKQAKKLGALVAPRPAKYSTPTSGDAGFYSHAVQWMEEEHDWKPQLLINLRPTSPLRFASDIDKMVTYMEKNPRADGIKSVIPAPLHPYKMWHMEGSGRVGSAGKLKPLTDFDGPFREEQGPDKPRQKIQKQFPIYFQDGQVDITRRKFVLAPEALKNDNVWGKNLHGYVLDPRTSTDLDEPADFVRANKVYKTIQLEKKRK